MRRLTPEEFERVFPRRRVDCTLHGAEGETIVLDHDAAIDGIPAHVIVRSGVYAEIGGLVESSLTIEPHAVVHLRGLVDGSVELGGALCIEVDGHVAGRISGESDAAVVDPTGPADSSVA